MHCKYRLDMLLFIWVLCICTVVELSYGYRIGKFCNREEYPGVYSRDFPFLRCCKEQRLIGHVDAYNFIFDKGNCSEKIIREYPDDDLVTSMWRVNACKIKDLMGKQKAKIEYKKFVDFLTKDYTTENNVRNLIKDANTACPDGDKEPQEYKKIKAYLTCFYKEEEKICGEKWANTTAYKKRNFPFLSFENSSSCEHIPGIWKQKSYCCNGNPTPEKWTYYKGYYKNIKTFVACNEGIKEFRKDNNIVYPTFPQNYTMETYQEYLEKLAADMATDCYDACGMSPILFSNGTARNAPKIDLNSDLDEAFSGYTLSVKNQLKAYVFKQKANVKVPITGTELEKNTGISLEKFHTAYVSSGKIEKVKYYCTYYRVLSELVYKAVENYCNPN